jgi:hypothetical protein
MDSDIEQINRLFALPNEGELGLVKAYGIMEIARMLKVQRQRIMNLLGELIKHVEANRLWTLFPGNEFESSREFWERGVGIEYSDVQAALQFLEEVKPLLLMAGIDPDEYVESVTRQGLKAARTEARDINREIQGVPPEQVKDETRETIRERLGRYQDLPDTEIKALRDMQKGNTPSQPIYAKVTITVANGKPSAHVEYDLTLDEAALLQDHHAYIVMKLGGNTLDLQSLQTLMRNQASLARSTAPTPHVVDASSSDFFGLDDEDEDEEFGPLRRSA